MAKQEPKVAELVRAAGELEGELVKLETLASAARKNRLDSQKSIVRAAKELSEVLALPERLASGLQALGAAMQHMEARQRAALEPLAAYAVEIQTRTQKLDEHMRAFAALGEAAGTATALLQSARDRAELIENAKAKLSGIADDARALHDAAHADNFPELARQADALRQRVAALQRKLLGASPPH
jgi:chromosome segregation ATPase